MPSINELSRVVRRTLPFALIVATVTCAVCSATVAQAQIVEVQARPHDAVRAAANQSPVNVLNRGFVDYHTSGQLQASAQVVQIRIGDPYAFSLPIYLLTGATKSAFGNATDAEATVMDLIAPIGGFLSGVVNGDVTLAKSKSGISKIDLKATGALRAISAQNRTGTAHTIFGAGYVDGGVYAQTGAWDPGTGYQDGGVAWLQVVYAGSLASSGKMEEIFGPASEAPWGLRAEGGIFVKDKVNIKLGVILPQRGKDLPSLDKSQFRVALDYSVK